MELNWSTFILEIINFLVLVWIMKHFFYRPVLGVIARRRAAIEAEMVDARDLREQGEQLRQQYEHRLSDWEQERQQARVQLQNEIDEERARLMQQLDEALDEEREKARVTEQHRLQELISKSEEEAMDHGVRFASRLLQQVADPALEARLLQVLLGELQGLSPERGQRLQAAWGDSLSEAVVSSAFELGDAQRQAVQQAIQTLTGRSPTVRFARDPDLLAGLRITLGAWVLGFNLRDELRGFAELVRDD